MSLRPSLQSIIREEMGAVLNRRHITRLHRRDKDLLNRLKVDRVETRAAGETMLVALLGFNIYRIPQSVSSRSELQGGEPVL